MQFHDDYSRPTPRQLEGIGRVAANWAVLEYAIESVLAKLAMAPDFPALALTNNLSIDNRLEAFRNLVDMHETRYQAHVVPEKLLDELKPIPRQIAALKGRRNKIVHYIWFRNSDTKLVGVRFKGRQASDNPQTQRKRREARDWGLTEYEDQSAFVTSVKDLDNFAARIERLSTKIFDLCTLLPEVEEVRHARSLGRK